MQVRGKLLKRTIIAICVGLLAGTGWFLSMPMVPTLTDAEEAFRFLSVMETRYRFRVMGMGGERPAVYTKPGARVTDVFVYGDYSPGEQNEICTVARAVQEEIRGKTVHLYFYPRELENAELMRMEVLK